MNRTLSLATYNIHKGVSSFNARLVLQQQKALIHELHADIVFLQEVRGAHRRHHALHVGGQHEFLAGTIWRSFAYGKNAIRSGGHHGNAILSKYPIVQWQNIDISASKLEERGMLHCEIAIAGWDQHLHCICLHLGLFSTWRARQISALSDLILNNIPSDAPLIIAGDFNDWGEEAGLSLSSELGLSEAFSQINGKPARSFPSLLPLLRLDRIYTRGFQILHTEVHAGPRFANLSDHAALTAQIRRDLA